MKNNTLCNRHSLGVNNHTKMYVTYTRIYGWSDYGGESSYQPRYRLENMMWMTLLVYDYIIPGGGTLNCPILTTGGYGAEIQYQGVTVLSNLGNGWGYEMTPAELAKKDEFYSIYWSEYNLVKESGSSELRDYLNQDRPSFEARA